MILTSIQQKLIVLLSGSPLNKLFYLSGGTALSQYYLHHRLSFDLDFFSEKPFSYDNLLPFVQSVKAELQVENMYEEKIHDRWLFRIEEPEKLFIEFVYYNHEKKRIAPLVPHDGIYVDSLPDIAANKVLAYMDRNEPKDIYDIYFLLTQKYSVEELLNLVKRKVQITISEFTFWGESAKGLKLLDTLQPYIIANSQTEKQKKIQKVKDFFLTEGASYVRRTLRD